jgi:hypothetical protein
MRLWFPRRAAKNESAREQVRAARGKQARRRQRSGPPSDDPIKNWESGDQAFLRQAGDPFDG